MDILTQLNKAMAYIEDHIDDDLALAPSHGTALLPVWQDNNYRFVIACSSIRRTTECA